MMVTGVYPGLSRDKYEKIEGVNVSTLCAMEKSPKHYRHLLLEPKEDTDAMRLGRAAHMAVFEPERFASAVAKWTGKVRRGKEWDAFCDENAGREVLTADAYDQCLAIQRAVRSDKYAMPYLSGGRGEVSLAWTHTRAAEAGRAAWEIHCRGRLDFIPANAIVDLKTTRDVRSEPFGRQSWGLKYHTKAAWYADGYELASGGERRPFVIVAVEAAEPHDVVVYRVPESAIDLGREEYRDWLDRLAWCRETSTWPGYAETELELELPRWAVTDDEDLGGLGLTSGGVSLAAGGE